MVAAVNFPPPPDGKELGWLKIREKRSWLNSLEVGTPFNRRMYLPMPKTILKPREWLKIEDQNGFGSCQGHSLSTATEIAYWLATGGDVVQLSRWMAYVGTQTLYDGIRGDQGSTISGGASLVKEVGICPEDLYPYPSRYTSRITQAQKDAGAKYRLKTFRRMQTSTDIRNWLNAGTGAISIGVRWGRGGGHAICLCQTDDPEDPKSDFIYANSWGTSWGENGFGRWTEREMQSLMRDNYTVAIGMTDMPEAKPRYVDWNFFK